MKMTGGVLGTKAITLSDQDNFLDWLVSGGDGDDPQGLYKAVAWTFWCVNLRANNIAQIPYAIYPADLPEKDEDEENAIEYEIDLGPILWDVEAWLDLKAAAYVLKRSNQVIVKELQVLNSNTMKVQEVDADGPTVFRQQVGARHWDYPADEILYFRTFNPKNDIREGVSSGQVGSVAGSLVKNANLFGSSFFENGAIPAVLLVSDATLDPLIAQEVETRWNKLLKGVRRAFKTLALGSGLKPHIIGQPIKDLAMPELEVKSRNQILAAHQIPPGLAEAKTNRAERDALQYELWTQSLIPWTMTRIAPVLNEGLFAERGYRISFQYHKLEAIQKEEIAKAESLAFAASGIIIPAYEANLVSIDESRKNLNEILKLADLPGLGESFTPEPRAPAPTPGRQVGEGPGNTAPPGSNIEETTRPKALPPEWGRRRVSTTN